MTDAVVAAVRLAVAPDDVVEHGQLGRARAHGDRPRRPQLGLVTHAPVSCLTAAGHKLGIRCERRRGRSDRQNGAMAVLIDEPRWWFRGRTWCHLVSDTSLDELHAFVEPLGIPRRAFQGDHYDIPEEHRPEVVAAGAVEVEQPRARAPAAGGRAAAHAGRSAGPAA